MKVYQSVFLLTTDKQDRNKNILDILKDDYIKHSEVPKITVSERFWFHHFVVSDGV